MNIPDITCAVECGHESWLQVWPCPLILMLFLCPEDLCISEFLALLLHQIEWERRDLRTNVIHIDQYRVHVIEH